VERTKLGRRAELLSIDVDQPQVRCAGEQLLVSLCQRHLARSIGNDQHLEQRDRRGHDLDRTAVDGV